MFGSVILLSCRQCGYRGAFLLLRVRLYPVSPSPWVLREACYCCGRQFGFSFSYFVVLFHDISDTSLVCFREVYFSVLFQFL